MKLFTKSVFYISCLTSILFFLVSCKSGSKSESEIQIYSTVRDFNKLVSSSAKIVRVKFEITDVLATRSQTIEEVTDHLEVPHVIVAVLELDSKLHKQLVEQVKSEVEINNVILTKESLRSWFPKVVKESILKKGNLFTFNRSAYDTQLLFKSDFYTGYFIFLDENFIFLNLFSKGGNR